MPPQDRLLGAQAGGNGASIGTNLGEALKTPASLPLILLLGCFATAASVGLQGFYFAVVNNSYHIPIVDGWIDDPQFANDQYIQSLRYHTSYVWPLAHLLAQALGTYNTFLLLHVANRLAMLVGMGLLVRELGVRTLAGLSACVGSLAITRYLLAASGPGEHDLFMPFLNHSSLTWPFIFASWLFLLQGRLILSLAAQGPVFAVNAFVAICGGPAVAAGALTFWPPGARTGFIARLLTGCGLALLIAGPTIAWILASFTDQPAGAPFSFLCFLHEYFLKHWYLTAASPRRLVSFVIVVACGLASLTRLGPRARCLLPVWCVYLAVFVAGSALPYLSDSRTLLVLHPMRVGAGCLVMLSVIASVAYLGRALETMAPTAPSVAAALGLIGFAAGQAGLVVTAAAIAVVAKSAPPRPSRWAALPLRAVALVMAGLLAVAGARSFEPPPYDVASLAAGRDAGLWIRAHTAPGTVVFVSSGAVDSEDEPVSVWTRRPVWYDWKEGAAVMWTPSYYEEWSARRRETSSLRSVDDRVAYACAKRIGIVVESLQQLTATDRQHLTPGIAYTNETYAVLRTAPLCATRQ